MFDRKEIKNYGEVGEWLKPIPLGSGTKPSYLEKGTEGSNADEAKLVSMLTNRHRIR